VSVSPAMDTEPLVRPFVNAPGVRAKLTMMPPFAPATLLWMCASVGLLTFVVTSHVSVLLIVSMVMKNAPTALLPVAGTSFVPRSSFA
jgi:hypothetical protein